MTHLRRLSAAALAAASCASICAAPLSASSLSHFERVAGSQPSDRGQIIDQMAQTFSYQGSCCGAQVQWVAHATLEGAVVRTADGTLDFHWRYSAGSVVEPNPYGAGADTSFLVLWEFFDPQFTYEAKVFSAAPPPLDHEVWVDNIGAPVLGEYGRPRTHIYVSPMGDDWFFFDTDARHYDKNSQAASHTLSLNIGGSGFSPSFQPVAAIPEPATWASLGLGIALLAAVARRRATATTPA
ncbi:PEP-CTERM sorting domain-containing protein [Schlegelella sp. S2-27]|uniref:PEP-CTERM sorting domain-containing protein n=1 Tax=Caldimonas mangrovi TaxID=2944811 RepID=A0ABT0YU29_9BURK|nr:PEP-CTERM sorting domain-containing protein [Caldimonas mangrovi]MCM5682254.1 PEP-CTERM sorting domain-containing protein [Caldimonas mangrovi]